MFHFWSVYRASSSIFADERPNLNKMANKRVERLTGMWELFLLFVLFCHLISIENESLIRWLDR